MKKLYLAILVMATVMLLGSSSAEANLLNNPGFETPGSWWSNPDMWSTGGNADAKGQTTGGDAPHGGSWVFSVANDWGGTTSNAYGLAAQDVTTALNTGDTATLKMYIKTDAGYTGAAGLKLEFLDSSNAVLDTALSSTLGAGQAWTPLTASKAIPSGTAKLKAYASSTGMGIGSKLAHFDDADLTVTPIPEPTSLLLLGSGLIGLFGLRKRTTK